MVLQLQEATARRWAKLIANQPCATLQQDWAYGDAVEAMGPKTIRLTIKRDGGGVLGLAQLSERRLIGGLSAITLMRGPLWLEGAPGAEIETGFIDELRRKCPKAVTLYTPECRQGTVLQSGMHRVMTGYSTIFLDLDRKLDELRKQLHGKWRNMLKRAEAEPFRLEERRSGMLVDWMLDNNEAHRRKIGYRGAGPDFYRALGQASMAGKRQTSLLATIKGNPVAGIMLQRHGAAASYLVGYTTEEGRKRRAHHWLLWQAVRLLKDLGVRRLDLGGVETVNAEGLARFKLGMGGELLTLAGTYLVPPRWR
jgi:hypothetical protein